VQTFIIDHEVLWSLFNAHMYKLLQKFDYNLFSMRGGISLKPLDKRK